MRPSRIHVTPVIARGVGDAARRSNAQRYRSLVQAFSDFVWIAGADGALLTDMPLWREVTGQSPQELLGDGWADGVHPEDRARVAEAWQAAVTQRTLYDVQYRISGTGGTRWYHARAAPVLDDTGAVIEWIGTATDVTAQRETDEAQRRLLSALESERRTLEQVIDGAPAAVCVVWGPDHHYRYFNRRYRDLLPGRRLEGKRVADAVPEADEIAIPLLNRARGGETIAMKDLGVDIADEYGELVRRYFTFTFTPLSEGGGGPGGVLIVATETTDDVLARSELRRQIDRERRVAERLQLALLPDDLPGVPGLDIAVRYLPAGEFAVGGDWYDAVRIDDDRIVLTIGDVCGRGVEAASVMSQVRAALRAYAIDRCGPSEILSRAARFVTHLDLPEMITAGVAVVDLSAGTLTWASAGHLPPILVDTAGAHVVDQRPRPPLGVDCEAAETTVPFGPDSTIVLYTDGVVEERHRGLGRTIDALAAVVAAGADMRLEDLCSLVASYAERAGSPDDDAAIMALRRARAPATP